MDEIRRIGFLPLGAFPPGDAEDLIARVSREVAPPCELLAPARGIEFHLLPGREQVDADALLEQVEQRAIKDDVALVALTAEDIGSALFTFFFGRARLFGRAALVSTARLQPEFYGLPADPELAARRAVREIVHELGHVAGVHHCRDYRCVMHFCTDVTGIDASSHAFCPRCEPRTALQPAV